MLLTRRTVLAVASGSLLSSCAGEMTNDPDVIDVRAPALATNGLLRFHGKEFRCALGRAGILENKHEGDGATPAGDFPLREVYFRPDRGLPPTTKGLPEIGRASCRE